MGTRSILVGSIHGAAIPRRSMRSVWVTAAVAVTCLVTGVQTAAAASVTFSGSGAAGAGIIGHARVPRAAIPHMNLFYAPVGVSGPYTELSSPDAFDFTTGAHLAPGTNPPPARKFGAALAAPHALAGVGIAGPVHIGISSFSLDYLNPSDLFVSAPFMERRIYRGGLAKIYEETAPNTFVELASYTGGTFTIDIDYTTGTITNVFTGTREAGSNPIFPVTWAGTSANPIDLAGSTSAGIYGTFDVTATLDVNTSPIPEPGAASLFAPGRIGLTARRRRPPRHA